MVRRIFSIKFQISLITLTALFISATCMGRVESRSLIDNSNNNGERINLSSKSDNLVNYLMKDENMRDHFSFVQEDAELAASYQGLLEQLSSGRRLQEVAPNNPSPKPSVTSSMSDDDMKKSTIKQIMIWLPIVLSITLFFVIMSLHEMPIQKNSILYAKYGTTKQLQAQ